MRGKDDTERVLKTRKELVEDWTKEFLEKVMTVQKQKREKRPGKWFKKTAVKSWSGRVITK